MAVLVTRGNKLGVLPLFIGMKDIAEVGMLSEIIGAGLRARAHTCWDRQALQVATQLTGKSVANRKSTIRSNVYEKYK
jgi:hypothetical protein